MHDIMKKPRHKTPSTAKRARSASGADEGDRQDRGRLGLPDFRGQVDYVLRLRIWQASSYLIGLMFSRAVCLACVLYSIPNPVSETD